MEDSSELLKQKEMELKIALEEKKKNTVEERKRKRAEEAEKRRLEVSLKDYVPDKFCFSKAWCT